MQSQSQNVNSPYLFLDFPSSVSYENSLVRNPLHPNSRAKKKNNHGIDLPVKQLSSILTSCITILKQRQNTRVNNLFRVIVLVHEMLQNSDNAYDPVAWCVAPSTYIFSSIITSTHNYGPEKAVLHDLFRCK